jgi:hypothetical protein
MAVYTPIRDITVQQFDVFATGNVKSTGADSCQMYWRSGSAITAKKLWFQGGDSIHVGSFTTDFNISAAVPCSLFFDDADGDSAANWGSFGNLVLQTVAR